MQGTRKNYKSNTVIKTNIKKIKFIKRRATSKTYTNFKAQ